jgi:hypothetical protein
VVLTVALHSIRSDTIRRLADPVTLMSRSLGLVRTRSHERAAMEVATTTAMAMATVPTSLPFFSTISIMALSSPSSAGRPPSRVVCATREGVDVFRAVGACA